MAISSKTEKKLNKRIYIGAGILAGLILILIILVVADSLAGGKLYIKNDTDKKIEEMHVFFDDDDGNLVDNLYEGSIDAGGSFSFDYGSAIKFPGDTYECVIFVKFEGEDELQINDGMFNADFNGNIRLNFYQKGEDYFLHTKAGLGVFELTKSTDMNTDIILYFDENDWDYVF
ncbi:MAG: hypothetical protein K6E62_09425 [Lachnospiraceae bacterium]|nr:hypothetical protein [Lachnospiraceae bacterium]